VNKGEDIKGPHPVVSIVGFSYLVIYCGWMENINAWNSLRKKLKAKL